jgi:hypothetical protein
MKWRFTVKVFVLLAIASVLLWLKWERDEPRRNAVNALQHFCAALDTRNSESLLNSVVLPQAVQGRTAAEQAEFLTKALRDEVSLEGLAVLKKEGVFGPLINLFPAEAEQWAKQAGVNVEDCVAFKLEKNGLRAEVVLVNDSRLPSTLDPRPSPPALRIVRCNNVKQLAAEAHSATDVRR